MKVKEGFDVYDELPEDMIAYLRYNGRHFNRRLVEFATSKMTTRDSNGTEVCVVKEFKSIGMIVGSINNYYFL